MGPEINQPSEDIFNELVRFLREEINEDRLSIDRKTIIEDDLGVSGDDADELIINFGKKFNVDISNFDFGKYFYSEPSIFPVAGNKPPLTVGHLEKAILAGQLDEEVINS